MSCSIHAARPLQRRMPIRVNGVLIPHSAIARETQNHPADAPVDAWRQAALALIVREALFQEAERRGLSPAPLIDAAGRRETPEEARMRAVVEADILVPEPNDAECCRFYEANPIRFTTPTLFEVAHILLSCKSSDEAALRDSLLTARTLLAELAVAPASFAELARRYSACPSAKLGGSLGQISRGDTTPAFEAALSRLAEGEITAEPVVTPYGVHIIRLDRKMKGRLLPFELVCDRIATYLTERVKRRAEAQFVARLIAEAEVEGIELPTPADMRVD